MEHVSTGHDRPTDLDMVRDILALREANVKLGSPEITDLLYERAAVRGAKHHRQPTSSCVYFIRCGEHVKIGYTTQGANTRLLGMQPPPGAEVVACIPDASQQDEADLHRRFSASRVRGEWFSLTPELEALINVWRV